MTADAATRRALANERNRHEEAIRATALRMQEQLGYLLKRLDKGHPLTGYNVLQDAAEIERRIAALECFSEVTGIFGVQEQEPTPQHDHIEMMPCNVMCPANPNTVKRSA